MLMRDCFLMYKEQKEDSYLILFLINLFEASSLVISFIFPKIPYKEPVDGSISTIPIRFLT